MKRPARLQSARHWIGTYEGKSLVRGYARRFGVDRLCAALELEMVGVKIDAGLIEGERKLAEHRAEARRSRKKKQEQRELIDPTVPDDWTGEFAYVAGYTSAGFPYGLTWEEWEAIEGPSDPDDD